MSKNKFSKITDFVRKNSAKSPSLKMAPKNKKLGFMTWIVAKTDPNLSPFQEFGIFLKPNLLILSKFGRAKSL